MDQKWEVASKVPLGRRSLRTPLAMTAELRRSSSSSDSTSAFGRMNRNPRLRYPSRTPQKLDFRVLFYSH
jgi:hypothetical protein